MSSRLSPRRASYPIFISYRRSDLSLEAEWLFNLIRTFFGEEAGFLDTSEIESGTRWDQTLRSCITSARLVLVLIGPTWLKAQAPSGVRRLDDPEDWVRCEVIAAIDAHRRAHARVFPVLVNGAELPRREWLPEPMADLVLFQAAPALHFDVRDYLAAAAAIHDFLSHQLRELHQAGLVDTPRIAPFARERVPNPYDIAGFELPEPLRLFRPEHPFKGFQYFHREDASIFFGRRREISELVDTFRKGRHLVRLFGQSGVGKSSLLFAGLSPRFETNGRRVEYCRRDSARSLADRLDVISTELEADDHADALVVLDQLEEIITAPDPAAPAELADVATATSRLVALNARRASSVRVIWAYRQEYDVDMHASLRGHGIDSAGYWLRNLDRDGMREAITGITRDRDLQAEYRLELEPNLADAILADFHDVALGESAAPLLQVVLRKMWDRVSAASPSRRFSRDIYDACKISDIEALLDERLRAVATRLGEANLRDAVESGLAIDMLHRFVTAHDTTMYVDEADVIREYGQATLARALLQQFIDAYLLVRESGHRYRLGHDTLARAVRLHYTSSNRPGQRAARLLEARRQEIDADFATADFSRADLITLDAGALGMRRWSPNEQKAIDESRRKRRQEEQDLEEKNRQLEQALASEHEQRREATSQRDRALITQSLFLSSLSRKLVEQFRYDQAVLLAVAALPTDLDRPERPFVGEAEGALCNALHHHRAIRRISVQDAPELGTPKPMRPRALFGHRVAAVAVGANAPRAAIAVSDNTIHIVSTESGLRERVVRMENVGLLEFAPDGSSLLAGTEDGLVRMFDPVNERVLAETRFDKEVRIARFSPDGARVVLAPGSDITLWDAHRWEPIMARPLRVHAQAARFSPDGRLIVLACYDNTARLLDGFTGEQLRTLRGHGRVLDDAAVGPGDVIATASEDLTARLWTLKGKQLHVLQGHRALRREFMPDGVSSVSFSPNGLMVATGGFDGGVRVWTVHDGAQVEEIRHEASVLAVMFHPTEPHLIVSLTDGSAVVWHLGTGRKEMHVWAEPRESTVVLRPACMDPAGKTLIVPSEHAVAIADVKPRGAPLVMMDISESEPVSPEPRSLEFTAGGDRLLVLSKDGSARIKRTGTGGVVSTLRHGGRIDHATFTRDGKRVVTVVANDGVHVRDGVTGRLIMRLAAHAGGLYSVACSPDGRFIAAAGEHGRAYVWDAESGALRHELQRHNVSIGHVAFSQDSAFVVTAADDRTARVWSVDTGTPVQVCTAADERITYSMSQFAMFEPAGRMLLTARLNRGAQLWDVVSGALLKEFRAERGGPVDAIVHATFSPDGTRLVTADSEGWATIWNCVTLEKELDLSCHSEEIDGVEFSPDGHRLLTYSWRARDARLWDAVTGQELVEYATYGSHVSAGALSPDGTRIAIGTEDGLVRLWTTLPRRQALIDLGRTVVPRALTDDERRQFFMTHASSAG